MGESCLRASERHIPETQTEPLDLAAALGALRALLALQTQSQQGLFDAYLAAAKSIFGMRTGVIGALRGEMLTFLRVVSEVDVPFADGACRPVRTLFVSDALKSRTSLLCHNIAASESLRAHPIYLEGQFESYASAPIRVGPTLFGVLSLLDPEPRTSPFDATDRAFLELLADTLGRAIERQDLEARRRAAETQRREASLMFSAAFANAPIGMMMVGLDGRFLEVNAAACAFLGYAEPDLLLRDFQSITHPDDLPADLELVHALLTGVARDYQIEKRYLRPNGEAVWAQLNATLVRFEDGTPRCFIAQIQDINTRRLLSAQLAERQADLEAANQKLQALADIDALTGILNRRALDQKIEDALRLAEREGTKTGFIMVDVDHFKAYNDAHGHLEGDAALKGVARVLERCARKTDVVGRFGGEEFLVVLPKTDPAAVRDVAERIRRNVEHAQDLRWPLTVSAGLHVVLPQGRPIDPQEPISRADTALYLAKQNGRNRVEMA
ncbi:MAG: diguanylate cyclase [Pseudomonadota bacterium]